MHEKGVQPEPAPATKHLAELDALLGVIHGPVLGPVGSDPATAARTLMINAVRRDGRYIGGAAPYGYRLIHDQPHHNSGKAIRGHGEPNSNPTATRRRSCRRSSTASWPATDTPP